MKNIILTVATLGLSACAGPSWNLIKAVDTKDAIEQVKASGLNSVLIQGTCVFAEYDLRYNLGGIEGYSFAPHCRLEEEKINLYVENPCPEGYVGEVTKDFCMVSWP